MHRAFVLVFVLGVAAAATARARTLDHDTLAAIGRLGVGESVTIDRFPDGAGGAQTLRFERIDVYAPGARVVRVDKSGEHELPRSRRIELIGASADGRVRTSLSLDPDGANPAGVGASPAGPFTIVGTKTDRGTTIGAVAVDSTLPAGVVPRIEGGDDSLPSGRAMPSALEIALEGEPSGSLRGAVLAIDTDNEFMSERFSNNTGAATSWIADLITAMNVMYERDLNVSLTQGTTFLRTTTDPYTQNDTPADQADLQEFGSYWQTHYSNVSRSFAALLSGKSSSGNSASGIAWVNAYCQTQSQGGSYSVTQIFTNPQIGLSYSALIVGHELGHNFGAYHTHCTNITTGAAPTGSNTIDKCYSGESSCYSGPTSCPSTGPGAPAGTVMSYCNLIQCGSGGQNVLQFHPTQITVLNTLITQNTPSCISAMTDLIFRNGFD